MMKSPMIWRRTEQFKRKTSSKLSGMFTFLKWSGSLGVCSKRFQDSALIWRFHFATTAAYLTTLLSRLLLTCLRCSKSWMLLRKKSMSTTRLSI